MGIHALMKARVTLNEFVVDPSCKFHKPELYMEMLLLVLIPWWVFSYFQLKLGTLDKE